MIDRFSACLDDVDNWLTASRLRPNASKTHVTWLGSSQQLQRLNIPHVDNRHPVYSRWCRWHSPWLGSDNRQPTILSSSCWFEPLGFLSAATTPPNHPLTDNGSSQDDNPSIYFVPLGLL